MYQHIKGFKIVDYTGKNWLTFTYDIDATHYFSDKQGFLGNYSLGKFMRIINYVISQSILFF